MLFTHLERLAWTPRTSFSNTQKTAGTRQCGAACRAACRWRCSAPSSRTTWSECSNNMFWVFGQHVIYNIIWGSLVFKLPLSLPLCVGWGCFPRFGARWSWHSGRSNVTFLEVYGVSPRAARVSNVLGSKSCSRCGLACMCSSDHDVYRLDRSLALSGAKVCTIIALFACTFRKRL